MKLLRQGANRATLNHNWIDRTRIQPGHGQRIRKSVVMEEAGQWPTFFQSSFCTEGISKPTRPHRKRRLL